MSIICFKESRGINMMKLRTMKRRNLRKQEVGSLLHLERKIGEEDCIQFDDRSQRIEAIAADLTQQLMLWGK